MGGILTISRVVADLDRAERFYRDALAFRTVGRGRLDGAIAAALGAGGAEAVGMRLGSQDVALVRFDTPGRHYPPASRSNDLWFQHLAIVVDDIGAAYAHLSAQPGWTPISAHGPVLLPPANGSVRAFKFRDPDGHPLELIWFPPGQGRPVWHQPGAAGPFLGIDHTALAIAATGRSVAFYRSLGLMVSTRSLNQGPAQAQLDGLAGARVRVTGLRPGEPGSAGIELLAYLPPGTRAETVVNDVVTDWVTLAAGAPGAPRAVQDPDGHRLVLVDQGIGAPASGPAT